MQRYVHGGRRRRWLPRSYEDIRCALSAASELAGASPLTVVGYRAGADLVATVVRRAMNSRPRNALPSTTMTCRVRRIGGPYELSIRTRMADWFGMTVQDDPNDGRWVIRAATSSTLSRSRSCCCTETGTRSRNWVQRGIQCGNCEDGFDVVFDVLEGADDATIVVDPRSATALKLPRSSSKPLYCSWIDRTEFFDP